MDEQSLMALASKMAFVAEQFQRNCQELTQNMSQFAAKTPGVVRQALQQQLESVTDEIAASVMRGLGLGYGGCAVKYGKVLCYKNDLSSKPLFLDSECECEH